MKGIDFFENQQGRETDDQFNFARYIWSEDFLLDELYHPCKTPDAFSLTSSVECGSNTFDSLHLLEEFPLEGSLEYSMLQWNDWMVAIQDFSRPSNTEKVLVPASPKRYHFFFFCRNLGRMVKLKGEKGTGEGQG